MTEDDYRRWLRLYRVALGLTVLAGLGQVVLIALLLRH